MAFEARWTGVLDPVVAPMLADLENEYTRRYGPTGRLEMERYQPDEFAPPGGGLVILLEDGALVAGGAFRPYEEEDGAVEVKRVWTAPERRRQGLARRVMAEIEAEARRRGHRRLYLTTGPRQPEARGLYLALGFTPLFEVEADPLTLGPLAFEKLLDGTVPSAAEQEWKLWHEGRLRQAHGPLGALALTGTHWIEAETAIPGVPGVFLPEEGGVRVKAVEADGLEVRGQRLEGSVFLPEGSGAEAGELRLAVIVKDGVAAVRVFDGLAPARVAFDGISSFGYDPAWVRPATFVPYGGERVETVGNADGVSRGLALAGEVVVELPDGEVTLAVSRSAAGLNAVFADGTSGLSTFRFRFLDLPEPDAEGRTVADFNRAHLPSCAFGQGFLCPFPPAGNTLAVEVTAGERQVRRVELSPGGHGTR